MAGEIQDSPVLIHVLIRLLRKQLDTLRNRERVYRLVGTERKLQSNLQLGEVMVMCLSSIWLPNEVEFGVKAQSVDENDGNPEELVQDEVIQPRKERRIDTDSTKSVLSIDWQSAFVAVAHPRTKTEH